MIKTFVDVFVFNNELSSSSDYSESLIIKPAFSYDLLLGEDILQIRIDSGKLDLTSSLKIY